MVRCYGLRKLNKKGALLLTVCYGGSRSAASESSFAEEVCGLECQTKVPWFLSSEQMVFEKGKIH